MSCSQGRPRPVVLVSTLNREEPVFIDANIFIYHFAGISKQCTHLFERIRDGKLTGLVNTIILAEVLHRRMIAEAIEKGLCFAEFARISKTVKGELTMSQKELIREEQEQSISYSSNSRNEKRTKSFNALKAWIELSKEVQEDFRKRGITKEYLEDAIAWARRNGKFEKTHYHNRSVVASAPRRRHRKIS